jgi:tetratricopeptide (TPR) repeat protein
MTTSAGPDLLALARRDPERALRLTAERLASENLAEPERAWLHHAAGLARLERGELAAARQELDNLPRRASGSGELALTRAWIEFQGGAPRACGATVNAALGALGRLDEGERAWALALRGNALRFLGEPENARSDLDFAVSGLARVSARLAAESWLAGAHNLRAAARLEWGDLPGADSDFAVAARLFAAQGMTERAAGCAHNRGCVALRRGEPRAALRCFEQAERAGLCGEHNPETLVDRAEALLAAGRPEEAREDIVRAAAVLRLEGRATMLAEAVFRLGQCEMAAGEYRIAARCARHCAGVFFSQRRKSWLAASLALHSLAELRGGVAGAGAAALRRADAAGRLGWHTLARELRDALTTAAAVAAGDPREALRWLDRQRASTTPHAAPSWTFTELTSRLGGRTLLHFGVDGDALMAVSVVGGRLTLHRLGPRGALRGALDRFRLSVRAGRGVTAAARTVQGHLIDPVGSLLSPEGLVIVAAPDLAGLCWAELPACRGRPVSLSPSIATLLHADARLAAHSRGSRLWVAGPELAHAEREVRTLAARYGGRVLTGSEARVDVVAAALEGAVTAHLAAHGRVRGGCAGRAGLRLADGELCGDELDTPVRVPDVVVLSACGTGASSLPAALLRRGARAVIASVAEVPDESVTELMHALHENLAAGLAPAMALARAQQVHGTHGFNCYGA